MTRPLKDRPLKDRQPYRRFHNVMFIRLAHALEITGICSRTVSNVIEKRLRNPSGRWGWVRKSQIKQLLIDQIQCHVRLRWLTQTIWCIPLTGVDSPWARRRRWGAGNPILQNPGWMYNDVHRCTPVYTGQNMDFSILGGEREGGGGATAARIADGDDSSNSTACAIGADFLVLPWTRIDFAIPVYGGVHR